MGVRERVREGGSEGGEMREGGVREGKLSAGVREGEGESEGRRSKRA